MKTAVAIRLIMLALAALACVASALAASTAVQAQDDPAPAPAPTAETTTPAEPGTDPAPAEAPADAAAEGPEHPGLAPFKANCASCHSIGAGKLTGPDLLGVKDRVPSEDWLRAYLKDPAGMIATDEVAKEMAAEFLPTIMPSQAHLSDQVVSDLIDFMFKGGPGLATTKLEIDSSPQNIELGRQLFTGETSFASGAPACISCHTTSDVGGLGGGSLGGFVTPLKADLTTAHVRVGGDLGMAAVLTSPQFVLMREVYARTPIDEAEVNALTAYFKDLSRRADAPGSSGNFFILYGLIGAAVLLVLLDIAWLKRFRAVRRPMVEGRQ